jgi:hypothetical protein
MNEELTLEKQLVTAVGDWLAIHAPASDFYKPEHLRKKVDPVAFRKFIKTEFGRTGMKIIGH